MRHIRFKGEPFIHVGEDETEGPISTPEQFEQGLCSHAHLLGDGRVMRFKIQIGTREDIEWLGEYTYPRTVDQMADALGNMLTDPSWPRNRT